MQDCAESYRDYVAEQIEAVKQHCPDPQMMCYALGALELFDGLYDIKEISMTIFQTRRENVSTYTMTKEELLSWAGEVLKPTAELAYEGKGEFKVADGFETPFYKKD